MWNILWEIHTRTYVLQSTSLTWLQNTRSNCDISPASIRIAPGTLKIAILVMYGASTSGEWGDELMKVVLENRYAYAKRHGYHVINANSIIDPSRPVAWSKLLAVKKHLAEFDYVFYIDTDAVIMNPDITLEELIAAGQGESESDPKDFIMTKDWNGPNTGSFFARRSKWTDSFLQLAWDQEQLVPPISTAAGHGKHPFEYEQRAFHYLLNTRVWKSRPSLPTYSAPRSSEVGSSPSDIWSHFSFTLPQCAMNSYSIHPLDISHRRYTERSQYVDGDFIIHFAGKKGAIKMALLRYYVNLAEQNFASNRRRV